MRLPWKTEGALIFFTVLNMHFLSFGIFEQLALALKNRVARKFFAVWNILFTFKIFENLRLPWKTEGALNSPYWMYFFIIRDFWATCSCPEIFHCIEYIFYYSGVLSNLRLPWKQSCPAIFHCIEYTFYIQNFWATCACPEKQRVSWINCIECIFFIIQNFGTTCACPEKQSCPGIFLLFRIFEELAVALKIFNPGGRPPRPPPRTPMAVRNFGNSSAQFFMPAWCSNFSKLYDSLVNI